MPPLTVSLEYRVPYADTDQMGVVYYANFLVYFERTRNELLRAGGCTYKVLEASGCGLPVIEAHCVYRQPALYDDLLTLAGGFEVLSATRLRATCQVLRDGVLLAEGYTVHACLALATRRPTRLPPALLALGAPPAAAAATPLA